MSRGDVERKRMLARANRLVTRSVLRAIEDGVCSDDESEQADKFCGGAYLRDSLLTTCAMVRNNFAECRMAIRQTDGLGRLMLKKRLLAYDAAVAAEWSIIEFVEEDLRALSPSEVEGVGGLARVARIWLSQLGDGYGVFD